MKYVRQRFLPLSLAAVRLGMSRDRLARSIQRGEIRGSFVPGKRNGRWYVEADAVNQALAERSALGTPDTY